MSKIELGEAERSELERYLSRGKANARNIKRDQILLKSADGWLVARIIETFATSAAIVPPMTHVSNWLAFIPNWRPPNFPKSNLI